jgi:putative glutamine amidotransferase
MNCPASSITAKPTTLRIAVQYAPAHTVDVQPGGVFEATGAARRIQVNSIHSGHRPTRPGLRAEALAPDGLIEAISVEHSQASLGVQWHPEWQVLSNPAYLRIFQAFGEACRQRAALRHGRTDDLKTRFTD